MFTAAEIAVLVLIAGLGHAIALCWYLVVTYKCGSASAQYTIFRSPANKSSGS